MAVTNLNVKCAPKEIVCTIFPQIQTRTSFEKILVKRSIQEAVRIEQESWKPTHWGGNNRGGLGEELGKLDTTQTGITTNSLEQNTRDEHLSCCFCAGTSSSHPEVHQSCGSGVLQPDHLVSSDFRWSSGWNQLVVVGMDKYWTREWVGSSGRGPSLGCWIWRIHLLPRQGRTLVELSQKLSTSWNKDNALNSPYSLLLFRNSCLDCACCICTGNRGSISEFAQQPPWSNTSRTHVLLWHHSPGPNTQQILQRSGCAGLKSSSFLERMAVQHRTTALNCRDHNLLPAYISGPSGPFGNNLLLDTGNVNQSLVDILDVCHINCGYLMKLISWNRIVFNQRAYITYVRQLKRIDNMRKSPIFAHFDESIVGASSIRAYGKQEEFVSKCERLVDESQRAFYMVQTCSRWIASFGCTSAHQLCASPK